MAMDELEMLKKDWQSKEAALPKLSFDEIHKMLWKKSSSIVKWIFIISIIEFALPHIIYFLPAARSSLDIYNDLGLYIPFLIMSVIQYSVVFYFIYLFYKRFKEISVLEDAKSLMSKIISTRKTVKYYVIFCLSIFVVSWITVVSGIYLSDDYATILSIPATSGDLDPIEYKKLIITLLSVMGVILLGLLAGFYFLLYGLLLRKLNKNYAELKKMEV